MSKYFAQFCDDIRQESNGKWLLIGCYGKAMIVGQFPFNFNLSCFVSLAEDGGFAKIRAQYGLRSGAILANIEIGLEETRAHDGGLQLPLPALPIQLSSPDEIVIRIGFDDEPFQDFGSLAVKQGTVPPPLYMAK